MLKEMKMYTVTCDICGSDAFKDWDYSCYWDESTAKYYAIDEHGFIEKDKKHYCVDCYKEDEEWNYLLKDKWRIIYNFWDRKWMDYAPKHFKTELEAEAYIIWFEWTYSPKDDKFIIEKCF
jgi:hypothetical protein